MALEQDASEKQPTSDELKLSEREIAIARGEDPDAPQITSGTESEQSESPGDSLEAGQPGKEAGKEATLAAVPGRDDAGGRTDAAQAASSHKSWLNDETSELVASYGLTAAQAAEKFGSEEAFRQAAAVYDQQVLSPALAAAPAPTGQAPAKPEPTPATETKPDVKPASKTGKIERLDRKKFEGAGYDQETIAVVDRFNELADFVESERQEREKVNQALSYFQERAAVEARRQELDTFHDLVDGLSEDRYGRSLDDSGKVLPLPKDKDENRKKLYDTFQMVASHLVNQARESGQPLPPARAILKRAENFAFAQEIQAEVKQRFQRQVAEQSRRRRPAAGARPVRTLPGNTGASQQAQEVDLAKEIASLPEIDKFWKQAQEANGTS